MQRSLPPHLNCPWITIVNIVVALCNSHLPQDALISKCRNTALIYRAAVAKGLIGNSHEVHGCSIYTKRSPLPTYWKAPQSRTVSDYTSEVTFEGTKTPLTSYPHPMEPLLNPARACPKIKFWPYQKSVCKPSSDLEWALKVYHASLAALQRCLELRGAAGLAIQGMSSIC